jgi:hypothetical protein
MKVVCVDDHTLSSGRKINGLTVGKIYEVNNGLVDWETETYYPIVDDNGQPTWYSEDVLMPLEKYRDLKLKDLLDN